MEQEPEQVQVKEVQVKEEVQEQVQEPEQVQAQVKEEVQEPEQVKEEAQVKEVQEPVQEPEQDVRTGTEGLWYPCRVLQQKGWKKVVLGAVGTLVGVGAVVWWRRK